MNLCIFEDEFVVDTHPLTYTRPVFELTCGILRIREKIQHYYPGDQTIFYCREYLANVVQEQFPEILVNTLPEEDTLFINGRLLTDETCKVEHDNQEPVCYISNGKILAAFVPADNIRNVTLSESQYLSFDAARFSEKHTVEWQLLRYPWEYVEEMSQEISKDIERLGIQTHFSPADFPGVHALGSEQIYVTGECQIKPGSVLDASSGPIVLDEDVVIGHNATVLGPCYIGAHSKISPGATLTGKNAFGPVCKIGGEVGETIILGYSNKKHDGYLGGAYLGEWINLGANTNNSDLKNNYSNVTIPINGIPVDTGLQFAGCVMGDHAKTAIGTTINTGSVIGVGCNVFGAGFPPKYLPSFSWGGGQNKLSEYRLDKMLSTAETVLQRRDVTMTPAYKDMLTTVFNLTRQDRSENISKSK